MAKKKWRKYKALITQKAYERLSKQVDDIFKVKLPDIRKKIQEATGDEKERLEQEKIVLLRSILRYNRLRNYAYILPETDEQPQVSVHTNRAFVGSFIYRKIMGDNKTVGHGTLLNLNGTQYMVLNVMLTHRGITLEVTE